ncbi:MAG: S8 family serine peptidase [bacterium]
MLVTMACNQGGGGGGSDVTTASISGTLGLPQRLVLDYDTNDPNNSPSSNDTFDNAQPIDNLVTVAGFAGVNIPDDPQGNPHPDDPADVFKAYLKEDEKLTLRIANPDPGDLDLKLYEGTTLVDSSTTTDQAVESVTVAEGGTHFVKVEPKNGGTNYSIYNLAVGLSGTSQATTSPSTAAEFVIGEAVVKFKKEEFAGAKNMKAAASQKASAMNATLRSIDPRGMSLLRIESAPGTPVKELSGSFGKKLDSAYPEDVSRARKETLEWIKDLNRDPGVAYAEPNYIYHPTATTPNDELFSYQWDKPAMYCELAWDETKGSTAVVTAVVDTGLLYDHPDISANVLRDGNTVVGYDMIADPDVARDGDGRDPNPYDVGDLAQTSRSSFHGTHVAGIAAAVSDGTTTGVAGTSWFTRIMPVRALGKGGGTGYDVAQSIYYAAGLDNVSETRPRVGTTVVPADIINLSLGGPNKSTAITDAVTKARAKGSIIIAAAGNASTNDTYYPAANEGVVGVSATDYHDNLAYYSNYGDYIDLAAPGGDMNTDYNNDGYGDGIISTLGDDSDCSTTEGEYPKPCIKMVYGFYQGTSMAAPNVSGVVALMIAAYNDQKPEGTFYPEDLDNLIQGKAGDTAIGSITNYEKGQWDQEKGYGIIDADRAVEAAGMLAGAAPGDTAKLVAGPNSLFFGFDLERQDVYVSNRGGTTLEGLTVEEPDETWLSINRPATTTIPGDSTVTISFTVDRSQVNESGSYSATVTIGSSTGGNDTVEVNMSKGDQTGSNAGVVYVILIEKESMKTVSQDMTSYAESYNFTVSANEGGTYYLAAGTDLDDDYKVGDNGELFGMYPGVDQPEVIHLTKGESLTGKGFSLQFMGMPVSAVKPADHISVSPYGAFQRLR